MEGQECREHFGAPAFSVLTHPFYELMSLDRSARQQELLSHEELFVKLYDRLQKELLFIRELMLSSLWRSEEHWGLSPE